MSKNINRTKKVTLEKSGEDSWNSLEQQARWDELEESIINRPVENYTEEESDKFLTDDYVKALFQQVENHIKYFSQDRHDAKAICYELNLSAEINSKELEGKRTAKE